MKKKTWFAALLLVPLGAAFAFAQDKPQDKKAVPAAAPSDDPMMQKMIEYGTPGPAHKVLEPRVGKWTYEMKCFESPGATATPSKGTSEAKWSMNGRFIEDKVTGDFMGQPFHGTAMVGYDNLKKKYISTWMDDMSTGIMYSEGTYDPATKTFTYSGECPDVMTGKFVKSRSTEKWTDADHVVMQSFKPGPDGKEFMAGEMNYTRAK